MKYMLLMNSDNPAEPACTVEDWVAFDKEITDAGVVVSSHALKEPTMATTVRVNEAGERVITDGPYAEVREVLGGFYVIDVADLDVALDWAGRCPGARDGWIVVRPVDEDY